MVLGPSPIHEVVLRGRPDVPQQGCGSLRSGVAQAFCQDRGADRSPLGLHGIADSINRPAYSTAVGLLLWGLSHTSLQLEEEEVEEEVPATDTILSRFGRWLRTFIP